MLRLCFMRCARCSGVEPLPNRRSKTTCGLSSIGSGLVRGTVSFRRRRQLDPRDRVRVRAAVALAAVARARVRILDGQLQRRQQRLLADLLRDQLIDRRAADGRIGAGGLARLDAGEERGRHPVVRTGRAFGRLGRLRPQAAQHDRLVLDVLRATRGCTAASPAARLRPSAPSGPGPCRAERRSPTKRLLAGAAAVCASAVPAGTIASSSGSASVTPAPCRNVRRGMCLFVMNIMTQFDSPGSMFAYLDAVCSVPRQLLRCRGFARPSCSSGTALLFTTPSTSAEKRSFVLADVARDRRARAACPGTRRRGRARRSAASRSRRRRTACA